MGAFRTAPLERGSAQGGFRDDVKVPVAEGQARCPVSGAEILPGSCHHLVPWPKVVVLPLTVPVRPTWDVCPGPSPDCHTLRFPPNCKYENRAICIFDIN